LKRLPLRTLRCARRDKIHNLLFNKRDYALAEKRWSPQYTQHGAHIAPGPEGLFDLVKSLPAAVRQESGNVHGELLTPVITPGIGLIVILRVPQS
jgi:hypothetical protein